MVAFVIGVVGCASCVVLGSVNGPGIGVSAQCADSSVGDVYRSVGVAAAATESAIDLAKVGKLAQAPATAQLEKGEYVLDNGENARAVNGIRWSLPLRQKAAAPFAVSVESLFEKGTEGTATTDYSLYLDVRYADKTSLYGQTHSFVPRRGRGWQKGAVAVCPDKPVSYVDCYCLLRNRDGRVRFRAPKVKVFDEKTDFSLFDTTPVVVAQETSAPVLLLHDAAAENDGWCAVSDGCTAKGVKVALAQTADGEATRFDVKVEATSSADRALTLAYSVPLPEGMLEWLDDPRTAIVMEKGQYRNTMNPGCGVGALSRWPFGAVRAGGDVWALGYDPEAPAIFRVVANGGLRRLFIAFDVGLTKENREARFKFVSFRSNGKDGFRGALARYATLFPEAYRVRIKKHGIWMAFRPIGKVEGFEDFGFGIKEGAGDSKWDDAHGILTTHYTEPTSWWMTMKTTNAVSWADVLTYARAEATKAKPHPYAKAWQACTYHDEEGEITGAVCDRPWCKGCVWNMNPLPAIPGGEYETKHGVAEYADRYNGKSFPEGVDGEYIDSAECHLPPRIDFNRANFRYAKTPLCWATASKRPGVATALSIYEYVRHTADRVHAMGRIMQANGAPYSWPWLIPYVDYGGQETKWIVKGEGAWQPMSDRDLLYRMAMSYGKPYCFLMNVKFENMTDAMVEKYFQRCLAYGLMSSFFSPNASGDHYFTRPDLYNRHRGFFLKYGTLQRRISEAGWRPLNGLVASETGDVFVEQFGDRYVTVFNSGDKARTARLRLLGNAPASAQELVTGGTWRFVDGCAVVEIPPESCRLLDFRQGR